MTRLLMILFSILSTYSAVADEFKVKLKVETVDHKKLGDATLTIQEDGNTVRTEKMPNDGDMKLELQEGRVYEMWIQMKGYAPHVIHNVNSNGDGKFKITLYRATTKYPAGIPPYHLAYRTFDDADELAIPAEMVNDHVHIVQEEQMSAGEVKALEDLMDEAKSQEKAQKKIENLIDDNEKLEKDKDKVKDDLKDGKIAAKDAEKEMEKIDKKIKSNKKEIKNLDYP